MVVEPDIDALLTAEPVRRLITADTELPDVHDDVQGVEIVRRLLVQKLLLEDVYARHVLDRAADAASQTQRAVQGLLTALHHLPSPRVHTGVDGYRRAGCCQDVGALPQPDRIHE